MSNIININGIEEFKKEVLNFESPVLVDFWAPWCGYCQMMGPILEELSESIGDKLKIVKINVEEEENKKLDSDYNIQTIPDMKLFKKGIVLKSLTGYYSEENLEKELKEFI